jgi:acyl carrier protein
MTPLATEPEIHGWLVRFVAGVLDVEESAIDTSVRLERLGVDSATTLVLAADLGSAMGVELSPVRVFEHRTIDALAAVLASVKLAEA